MLYDHHSQVGSGDSSHDNENIRYRESFCRKE